MTNAFSRQKLTRRLERLGFRLDWGERGGWAYLDWRDSTGTERKLALGFLRLTQVKEFADWLEAQVFRMVPEVDKPQRGGTLRELLRRMAKEDKERRHGRSL